MKILPPLLAAVSIVAATANAMAGGGSYSGSWPATVSHSQRANGAYCLTLTDDGAYRWPHSGEVSLATPFGTLPYGTFQVIGHNFVATVEQEGGEGQNAGLVFSAATKNGTIGNGIYDQVYGGEAFDIGKVAFGSKGGC